MKNNRNTLLFIAGVAHIVRSIVSAVLLVLVSLFIEIIDVALKISIFRSKLYSYSPELGEKLLSIVVCLVLILGQNMKKMRRTAITWQIAANGYKNSLYSNRRG